MVCLLIDVVVWNMVIIRLMIRLGIIIVDISRIIMNMDLCRILINIFGDMIFFYIFILKLVVSVLNIRF